MAPGGVGDGTCWGRVRPRNSARPTTSLRSAAGFCSSFLQHDSLSSVDLSTTRGGNYSAYLLSKSGKDFGEGDKRRGFRLFLTTHPAASSCPDSGPPPVASASGSLLPVASAVATPTPRARHSGASTDRTSAR